MNAQQSKISVDLGNKGITISPTHYGIFFEDINHAADGGLYAELIRNRSFEDSNFPEYWSKIEEDGGSLSSELYSSELLNSAQTKCLRLSVNKASSTSRAGIANTGYWGINVVNGKEYLLSFFAKSGSESEQYSGSVTAYLENGNGTVKYASSVISGITTEWKKYTCKLVAEGNDKTARFILSFNKSGTIYLDVVSLFPPTYKNRENGLRPDLAQLIADMKPKFMRFPGGCYVEGDYLANRFQWKKSIGPIEERPGHFNLWGYRTTDGMGYHEFLQLAEDICAEPLFVINVGIAHNDNVSGSDLDGYLQDALDAIEYANGDITTKYGALRAANGHPLPFNMKYIEVGNENYYSKLYPSAYSRFFDELKAKYPEITLIGNVAAWGTDNPVWDIPKATDLIDEHYYRNPSWFVNQYSKYDSYDRRHQKVYVGEYAVTSGCGLGNLDAAVGEAVYMAGMEKNSDVVVMNSYAPVFVNVNDRKWNPDLINFSTSDVYCTPSYYVQKLFSNNIGTRLIAVRDSSAYDSKKIFGNIGLGTWKTTAKYDKLTVRNSKGKKILTDNFANASKWAPKSGKWSLIKGSYNQSNFAENCSSIGGSVADSVYSISLKAMKTGGDEGFLIIFGYNDPNNFYWWNIGGWGNTQYAIEQCVDGSKSTMTSKSGSIILNKWYDIRIEISTNKIKCYLDNELIHEFITATKLLYTTASLDELSNKLYIKVINPGSVDADASIELKGIIDSKGEPVAGLQGKITTLTSGKASDENSMEKPDNVIPVSSTFIIDSKGFSRTFRAKSVNVMSFDF
jgi:alpha-L-arabinofuranosidase